MEKEWVSVSGEQKMKAKAEQAKGKAKEAVGRITDDERLTAEGRAEQAKGDARSAKEKMKDIFKH
ncbi:CsbD family protein [Streptomyces hydrogenans]|uniref:CsbD family protein n=2 Tax=Streptomyces hydrogenans TaxID=1873719 RepID=UPI0035DE8C55